MNRTLSLASLLLAACSVQHTVGENETNQDAISCAATTCNGTTVCVNQACVEPSGTCGGFGGFQCPSGSTCVDNPRDGCTWGVDPDCGGVCVSDPLPPPDAGTDGGTGPLRCGGYSMNPKVCPSGYQCVENPICPDCEGTCELNPNVVRRCGGYSANPATCETGEICVDHPLTPDNIADVPGICIKRIECGGFAGLACPGGMDCKDNPTDNCDPMNGGADCIGYCVPRKMVVCGGFAGLACPAGTGGTLRCVDDPVDTCDPLNGGADCGGICVP